MAVMIILLTKDKEMIEFIKIVGLKMVEISVNILF
jgi:hypothetical protein